MASATSLTQVFRIDPMIKIRDSFFLKRIFILLLAAVLLWALFTSLVYQSITRPVMVDMKKRDLIPQTRWIAEMAANDDQNLDATIQNLVQVSYKFFTVWTIVYTPSQMISTAFPESFNEEIATAIMREASQISAQSMSERDVQTLVRSFNKQKGDFLFIAYPITRMGDDYRGEEVIGTVVMVQPLSELDLSLRSMNISLLLSALIVGILILIPAFFATRLMILPLIRIRHIAQAVTQGDFSKRAEVKGNNEISDLARAMNHMSERISESMNQLTLERNQLRQIIDGIAEGIVAVDAEGRITQINDAIYKILQRDMRQMTPEDLLKLYKVDELFADCLANGKKVRKTLLLDSDQKRILCQITPLFDADGKILTAVGLFRDVTEAERLEQTRRDYIANVSHELRTPITAMRALLEPLNDGMVKNEADRQRYYAILLRETLRLSRLIDDMLELSRLQSGTSSITQSPIDSNLFVEHISQHFALMADEHGLQFRTESPEEDLPMIWGNEDRIEQILIIYVDNAIKFTPIGGSICFRIQKEEKQLIFSIEDNGEGIAPDVLPFVFDRFYKADKAHNEKGTGLGLSLAKAIAEQMGMNVSVHSKLGEGASFSLGVPYAEDVLRKSSHVKEVFDSGDSESSEQEVLKTPGRKKRHDR